MTRHGEELSVTRRGHAVMDLRSRNLKAAKIAALIGATADQPPRRMLEIGTGSGGIAHYFGTSGMFRWSVDAIDVEDVRVVRDGFRFTQVESVELPFADASFDVVVSNHVIEHVGGPAEQVRHLSEIARVLRPDGVGYLAVPSRWMLIEPHYRLPFLSWLPDFLADKYIRVTGIAKNYDCAPLTVRGVEGWLKNAGLSFSQQHASALRLTFELECGEARIYRHFLRYVPDRIYAALRRLFPTLIYVLRHKVS